MSVHLGQLAGSTLGAREAHVVVPASGSGAGSSTALVASLVQHGRHGLLVHVHVGDGVQQAVDAVREVVHAGAGHALGVSGDT